MAARDQAGCTRPRQSPEEVLDEGGLADPRLAGRAQGQPRHGDGRLEGGPEGGQFAFAADEVPGRGGRDDPRTPTGTGRRRRPPRPPSAGGGCPCGASPRRDRSGRPVLPGSVARGMPGAPCRWRATSPVSIPPRTGVARQELVQDDAQGEDVRGAVRWLAAHLLGRHVGDGAGMTEVRYPPARVGRAWEGDGPGRSRGLSHSRRAAMIFSGLMSRWTTPAACTAASALAAWPINRADSSTPGVGVSA